MSEFAAARLGPEVLAAALEALPDGVALFDPDWRAGPLRLTGAIEGFVPLLRQMEDDCGYPLGVTFGEHGIHVRW